MNVLGRCFAPKSVALIGASRREGTIGYSLLKNITAGNYRGKIFPVNPSATTLQGVQCYPSLTSIGEPIDLVIIAVPAAGVKQAVAESISIGAAGAVIISAGFAEVSEAGRQLQDEVLQLARANNFRIVGPNCLGIINTDPDVSLYATFSSHLVGPGNVAFLSQSGAVGVAILDFAKPLNIGLSSFISVGNKIDVSSNDLLAYWSEDQSTEVIALYLESFGNPRKFTQIVQDLAKRKPIVAVKSGRSQAGQRAASSHSAALADRDVAISALFEQLGVIRVQRLEELFDLVKLFSAGAIPQGNRIGVITNAGGPGIILADACEAAGLKLPQFSGQSLIALGEILSANASFGNPVDLVASGSPQQFGKAVEIVGADPCVDALVVVVVPTDVTDTYHVAEAIGVSAARVPEDKPVLVVFLSTAEPPAILHQGPRGTIPTYKFPENAAMALSAAAQYRRWCNRPSSPISTIEQSLVARIRERIAQDLASRPVGESMDRAWLSTDAVKQIVELLGIEFARSYLLDSQALAGRDSAHPLQYPLVAKLISPDAVHKSDIGGVILGIENAEQVERAAQTFITIAKSKQLSLTGVLLQEQIVSPVEAFVGVSSDPLFGPLVVAGLGGIFVEVMQDLSFGVPPISKLRAEEMLNSLRAKKILSGFRGQSAADRNALIEIMMSISALVLAVPEILELDLNPVKLLAPGEGAVVVDGRILVRRSTV